jgi:hypothetical protein
VGDAPGVYRRDVVLAPPPALVTGRPIILGYAADGSVLEPTLVSSLAEYEGHFSADASVGYLNDAVQAFFVNGGAQAWIVRLEDGSATLSDYRSLVDGLAAATLVDADLVCAPDIVRQRGLAAAWQPGSVLPPDPDEVARMQEAVVADCERSRTRVAILDALPTGVLATAGAGAGTSTATAIDTALLAQLASLEGSDNATLYHPWLSPTGATTGRFVPPSGAVAGIIARSDQQIGVHKAPANEPVMGIVDVEDAVDAARQGPLNDKGVNCIRAFGGRGIRVWGARTVSSDPAWRYLNVRRVVLTAARWAALALQNVAFEPSMPSTWARVTRLVQTYLGNLYAQGALFGATAADAFSVNCDATTNSPEVRQLGQLVLEVTLNPSPPNEVVLLRLVRDVTGVTIESSSSPG